MVRPDSLESRVPIQRAPAQRLEVVDSDQDGKVLLGTELREDRVEDKGRAEERVHRRRRASRRLGRGQARIDERRQRCSRVEGAAAVREHDLGLSAELA
jgi:hypothetical protein